MTSAEITDPVSPVDPVAVSVTTSEPKLFYLVIKGLPTYGERYHIEAALSICRVYIQDLRYNFNKKTLTYKLSTEQFSVFSDRFKKTPYWNNAEIKYVNRT